MAVSDTTEGRSSTGRKIVVPLILVLLVLIAFTLRIPNIGNLGLIGDEGHQALAVQGILEHGAPIVPSGAVYMRSIIYLQSQALSARIFGLNEFSLRLPSLIFSLPSIIVIYLFGSTLFSRRVGLLSAFVLTLSAWGIEYARDARMYTAFQMLYMLSLLIFYRGFFLDRRLERLIVPLLFTVTIIFHQLGIPLLFAFALPFLVKSYSVVSKKALILYGVITLALFKSFQHLMRVLILYPNKVPGEGADRATANPAPLSDKINDMIFTPPIALLKQLISDHALVFVPVAALFAGAAIFILFKIATSPSRRLRWAFTLPIIASCFLYQFGLALLFIALFAILHCRDLRSLREREISFALALSGIFFLFYLVYALLYPPPISYFTIGNTFFGYPNIRGYFLRWLLDGWPRFTVVLAISAILLFRRFIQDKRRISSLFLLAMTLLPVYFCGVINWTFYSARYIFHLYPLLVIAFSFALFWAIDGALGLIKPAAHALAKHPAVHNLVRGALAIGLATLLTQDIYLADALAAGRRTYQSAKNPDKAITNSPEYASYHQDYKTPARFLTENRKTDDKIILMARAHVPPIYCFYLDEIDYVILERVESHFIRKKKGGKPRHYTTGSELILSAADLKDAIAENAGQRIWFVTDSHLIESFSNLEILEELEQYPRSLMYTGRDGSTAVYLLE